MAELEAITAALKRNRKDLDEELDKTLTRSSDAAALVDRIEELRDRAERVQRLAPAEPAESHPKRKS